MQSYIAQIVSNPYAMYILFALVLLVVTLVLAQLFAGANGQPEQGVRKDYDITKRYR